MHLHRVDREGKANVFPNRNIEFNRGYLSSMLSANILPDCQISIDEDFRQVIVNTRGHEVIIELGDTIDWKNPSNDEPFTGLKLKVVQEDDWGEDAPLVDVHLQEDTGR